MSTLAERLWAKVAMAGPDDCWLWQGGQKARGYGNINAGGRHGRTLLAHRVVYELTHGPIPTGYEIDHLCSQPPCCNPRHLEAVTPRENKMRSRCWTAKNARATECTRGHAYDEANTGYRKPTAGKGSADARLWRYCRSCAREDMAAKRAQKRAAA